jgi:hypothetical protein
MCDSLKIKLQQTTHALGVLAYNQRLLINNTSEDGWTAWDLRNKEEERSLFRLICSLQTIYRTETTREATGKSAEKCDPENEVSKVTHDLDIDQQWNSMFAFSQQIHDQRQRRLDSANRAAKLVSSNLSIGTSLLSKLHTTQKWVYRNSLYDQHNETALRLQVGKTLSRESWVG